MELYCECCKASILLPDDIEDEWIECYNCGERIPIHSELPRPEIHSLPSFWGQSASRKPTDKDACTASITVNKDDDQSLIELTTNKSRYKQPEVVCPTCGGALLQNDYILTCSKCQEVWCDVQKRNAKEFSKPQSKSTQYAPHDTCPNCGWSGKDWGFKYGRHCTPCQRKWRRDKTQRWKEWKEAHPELAPATIELSDGISVTPTVAKRLRRRAERELGCTPAYCFARLIPITIAIVSFYLMNRVKVGPDDGWVLGPILLGVLLLASFSFLMLQSVREREVGAKAIELAKLRHHNIEEQRRFYSSPEWKCLRAEVLREGDHICSSCGCEIVRSRDLTVDHIRPRSKFPELALDKSNLQIMCRSCNSAKGANYYELNSTSDLPTPASSEPSLL